MDGRSHDGAEAQAYDAERSRLLGGAGIRVLRVQNAEVVQNLSGVGALIESALQQ